MDKNEGMKLLVGRGMDIDEARDFLDGRPVVTKGLQLPPEEALAVMNSLSRIGIFQGPVRFFVSITESNVPKLMNILQEQIGKEPIHEQEFFLGDIGKDPIGALAKRVSEGYSGDADFQQEDPPKAN